MPGYNYCSHGNSLDNGPPVNELDAICQRHDYCYSKKIQIKMLVTKQCLMKWRIVGLQQ